MGKPPENTSMAADESQKQNEVIAEARKEWQNSSFCVIDEPLTSQEFGVGTTTSKIQRSSRVVLRGDIVKHDSGSCYRPKIGENKFPIVGGTVKLSGGDQNLRTSTSIQDNVDQGEEQESLLGESDGSSPPLRDSSWYDGEAGIDIWSISGNFI